MTTTRILVVEDDLATLQFIEEVLVSLNTEVHAIADGQAAVSLINEHKFDVIFLDLQMPNLDGFALEQIVRNSACNKWTPIVVVTGIELDDALFRSFALGATFFLRKPVDKEQLFELLNEVRLVVGEDRRRYTRVPVDTEVKGSAGARTLAGRALNLSLGGIQVQIRELQLGDAVQLSFRLDDGRMVSDVHGIVVWEKEGRQGINFTKMTLQNQADIRRFIARSDSSRQ